MSNIGSGSGGGVRLNLGCRAAGVERIRGWIALGSGAMVVSALDLDDRVYFWNMVVNLVRVFIVDWQVGARSRSCYLTEVCGGDQRQLMPK